MSAYDPAAVADAIEAVALELRRGAMILQTGITDTGREQHRREEDANRVRQLAVFVADTAAGDASRVGDIENLAQQALTTAYSAIDRCNQARSNAQAALDEANSALSNWRGRLARARSRLEKAQADLDAARQRMQICQTQLNQASSAYSACASYRGPNGECNNCSGYAAALNAAREAMDIAQARFAAAQEEVQCAEKQVAACEKAVDLSGQAVSIAEQASNQAQTALTCAQNSLDRANAARQAATQARSASDLEASASGQMSGAANSACANVADAGAQLRLADDANQQLSSYSELGRRQLEESIETLRRLDQPESLP